MAKLETGRFATFLRRYLQLKGETGVADELSPEISPVMTLEAERIEWEFLKGSRLLSHLSVIPDVAGNNSTFRLRNPDLSGVVGIVSKLSCGNGDLPAVPQNMKIFVTYGQTSADLSTVSGYSVRDGRMAPPFGGALVASFGYSAPGGNLIDGGVVQGNGTSWIDIWTRESLVIPPGWAVNVQAGKQQVELLVAVNWMEKRLDPLET